MEPSWARRPPVQEPRASGYRACLLAQTPSPLPIRVMQQINLVQLLWRKSEAQGHLALQVVLEAVREEAAACQASTSAVFGYGCLRRWRAAASAFRCPGIASNPSLPSLV